MTFLRKALASVLRERAVIAGLLVSIGQAMQAADFKWSQLLPILGGFILRWFVTPASPKGA